MNRKSLPVVEMDVIGQIHLNISKPMPFNGLRRKSENCQFLEQTNEKNEKKNRILKLNLKS